MNVATDLSGQLNIAHRVKKAPHPNKTTLESFLTGMRRFPGAVNVITTEHDEVRLGLTATAVCSLSAAPPRLLACLNTAGRTFGMVRSSGAFVVNSLAVGQECISTCFANPHSNKEDQFQSGEWTRSPTLGLPLLMSANCSFECSVSEVIESESHAMLVADILDVQTNSSEAPLLYCDGKYCGLLELF